MKFNRTKTYAEGCIDYYNLELYYRAETTYNDLEGFELYTDENFKYAVPEQVFADMKEIKQKIQDDIITDFPTDEPQEMGE